MLRLLPCLLAALALAVLATPAVASNDGLWGRKITICHVPPGKAVLDELGKLDKSRSKIVKIRTGQSARNGHELAEIMGKHTAHQYDFLANGEGDCAAAEPDPEPVPE